MRKVFGSHIEVCHVWAQQNQDEGRASRMFFEGAVIYSYGRHFPAGIFLRNDKGGELVAINSQRYSVSTGKHMAYINRAISHKTTVDCGTNAMKALVEVARYNAPLDHDRKAWKKTALKNAQVALANSAEYAMTQAAASAAKRRKPDLVARDIADGLRVFNDAMQIMNFYDMSLPDKTSKMAAALQSDFKQVNELNEKAIATAKRKQEREAKERAKKQAEAAAIAAPLWLVRKDEYEHTAALRNRQDALLRLNGDNIETSHGAMFPIEHGKRVFTFIRNWRERKEAGAWIPNGKTLHLGHYNIDMISSDGDVKAGCHVVKWEAIEHVARILKIFP